MAICKKCGAEFALARLEIFEGEESGMRVRIEGMPAYACANDHRKFLTADFPMRLIDAILKTGGALAAPQAVKKGLFRKRYHCPGCSAELPAEREAQVSSTHSLELKASAPFDVTLEVPAWRCAGCAAEAAVPRDEAVPAMMRAASRAFEAAGIPPG